ncbi:hypothetical protein MCOR05_001855 [Pyricularia oryzae]|nr:hypothetical protein MCOR05_001855 [Pyricularia oryzae]
MSIRQRRAGDWGASHSITVSTLSSNIFANMTAQMDVGVETTQKFYLYLATSLWQATAIETILAARPSFVNSDPDSQAFCWMLGTTVRLTRATFVCTGSLSAFAIRWNNRHISYMPANEQHLKAEGLLVRKIDGPLPSLIQLPESFSGAEVYEMVGSWSVWVMYDDLTDEELPLFPPLPAIDELLSGESTETIVII